MVPIQWYSSYWLGRQQDLILSICNRTCRIWNGYNLALILHVFMLTLRLGDASLKLLVAQQAMTVQFPQPLLSPGSLQQHRLLYIPPGLTSWRILAKSSTPLLYQWLSLLYQQHNLQYQGHSLTYQQQNLPYQHQNLPFQRHSLPYR